MKLKDKVEEISALLSWFPEFTPSYYYSWYGMKWNKRAKRLVWEYKKHIDDTDDKLQALLYGLGDEFLGKVVLPRLGRYKVEKLPGGVLITFVGTKKDHSEPSTLFTALGTKLFVEHDTHMLRRIGIKADPPPKE
jgi:hypothetical protein